MTNTKNTNKISLKEFDKAVDDLENIATANVEDVEQTAAILFAKISENNSMQIILTELTGVDLMSQEKLYEYFQKNITVDNKLIYLLAQAQLVDKFDIQM
jgi:hypothetical protein